MIFAALFLVVLLVLAFPFTAKGFQVVFVPSSRKDLPALKDALKLGPNDVVYDLGCGNGATLAHLLQDTGARGVGVDLSPLWLWLARRRYGSDKLKFRREDLFKTAVGEATVVYCFLIPKAMPKVAEKLKRELRPGSRIVSYVFPINEMDTVRVLKNDLGNDCAYIYRV